MEIDGDIIPYRGTTTNGENNKEVDMVIGGTGQFCIRKIHPAERCTWQIPSKNPQQLSDKTKGKKLQKEDARRETLVTLKKTVGGVLLSKIRPSKK
jgi:hypothetical protein